MRSIFSSRIPNSKYDAIVDGIVDSIEYWDDTDEYFAYVYSRDLEESPFLFYQGVVVFEPLTEDEVELDLHEGDRVKLGVVLQDDGNHIVDILERVG